MPKIEGECLKDTMDFMTSNLLGVEITQSDGSTSETYKCGIPGCPLSCKLTAVVVCGIIVDIKQVYSGGNCIVKS
jgi:anaerobic selenocysteine-containing dehydrogenase